MKIKLALLDNDNIYLERIGNVLEMKYSDKFETYSFTDKEIAVKTVNESRIDVLLANTAYEIDTGLLPKHCCFAYLVTSADIGTYKEQKAINKYQKVDLFYREILNLYSEQANSITERKASNGKCSILTFCSPSGGCGSSTMAAALAIRLSTQGKKVLYLNLETFGSADVFFSGDGQYNMSDVIFALKSKKSNLGLKLQSCVKQDKCGVYFYSQSMLALDMLEMKSEEVLELIEKNAESDSYDVIIIDLDFSLDSIAVDIYKKSMYVVLSGDGSDVSNAKIKRAVDALGVIEKSKNLSILNRTTMVYNKFSNKTSRRIDDLEIQSIGGFPKFEQATTEQVMMQISSMSVWDQLA